jgi:Ca2+-dependent lipid-binding protein
LRYKTEADVEGHTEPVWNQEINIPIYSLEEEIKIECIDIGIIYDELIGSTSLKISEV